MTSARLLDATDFSIAIVSSPNRHRGAKVLTDRPLAAGLSEAAQISSHKTRNKVSLVNEIIRQSPEIALKRLKSQFSA